MSGSIAALIRARCELDEAARCRRWLGDPMVGGGRHDQRDRNSDQHERGEMRRPFNRPEIGKTLIENRDQLKPEQCLDSRKHHPRLIDHRARLLVQPLRLRRRSATGRIARVP